ncbi:serine/threonine-protein kinase [bacterium]|nr:serine/threonine-protein kinase [bacterium]
MTKLGVLFNIEELGGGAYGYRAYRILFGAIDLRDLKGCTISDGDVGEWYCIAIESFDESCLYRLKSSFFRCNAKGLAPRERRFIEGIHVEKQPLVTAGYVDHGGEMQRCETGFVLQAWNESQNHSGKVSLSQSSDGMSTKSAVTDRQSRELIRQHPMEHLPGEMLGKNYLILDVRRGGMGLVYIVEDLASLRQDIILRIAFKTFQARYLWDENAIERFEREALNWVGLGQHPNIVHALLVQRIEAKPFIWLEFVDGESLAELLDNRRMSYDELIGLALQFCGGMRYAYEKHGVIHRDIKPGNIMIRKDGALKITDFGLSKIQTELAAQTTSREGTNLNPDEMQTQSNVYVTGSGMCVGTPAYLAPEAITNPAGVDTHADIYSFGIVLYEMLAGRRPFAGPHILEQHLIAQPLPLKSIDPEIPEALDRIVQTCLQKSPSQRFSSFAELERALLEVSPFGHAPSSATYAVGEKEQSFFQGFSFMELGKMEDAIRCFREVIQMDANYDEAYNNIGVCLGDLNRFEEAASHFEKAISLRAEYAEAWANLGGTYQRLGRYEEGLRACNRAILLKPDWAEAYSNKGMNLLGLGQFEEAQSAFDSAVQADRKYWKAYVNAGTMLAREGRLSEALIFFEKALAISPREADVLALAAACLIDAGRRAEAEVYLSKALTVDPKNEMAKQLKRIL